MFLSVKLELDINEGVVINCICSFHSQDMTDESWRRPNESDEEWRLRREFIAAHYGRFPDIRLKCLSSCFVNVECYGCRYPEPVMKLLGDLTVGLKEVARRREQIRSEVSAKRIHFVPASSNENIDDRTKQRPASPTVTGSAGNRIRFIPANSTCNDGSSSDVNTGLDAKQPAHSGVNASRTGESETLTRPVIMEELPTASQTREQECIFYHLGSTIKEIAGKMSLCKSDTEILQMALDKCKLNAVAKFTQSQSKDISYVCSVTINDVLIATGEASTKKAAKHAAFSAASEILRQPYLRIYSQLRLFGSTDPFQCGSSSAVQSQFDTGIRKLDVPAEPSRRTQTSVARNTNRPVAGQLPRRPQKRHSTDLSQFVILRSASSIIDEYVSPISVLQQSACFNKVELTFACASEGNQCRCCVTMDGLDIAWVVSDTRSLAQSKAAEQALKTLSQTCYSVIVKRPRDVAMDESVKRMEILDGGANVDRIPESNVGSLLLKKMGWTGGGIGKNGSQGVEEPVSVTAVINRAGLGSGVSGDFTKAVGRIVMDYLHSDREDDLVFSPEFSNSERAAIHAEARKHAQLLKSRSYGSKESRYLVLSRRRTPMELVKHIQNNGGETLKYILREPAGQSFAADGPV